MSYLASPASLGAPSDHQDVLHREELTGLIQPNVSNVNDFHHNEEGLNRYHDDITTRLFSNPEIRRRMEMNERLRRYDDWSVKEPLMDPYKIGRAHV